MIGNNRDFEILAALLRYKYLSDHQIFKMFFSHQTKANLSRVMKYLEEGKLVVKLPTKRDKAREFTNIFYLDKRGADALASEWGETRESIGYKRITTPPQSINHYYHRHRMIDFWVSLDKELFENKEFEVVEIKTDAKRVQRGNLLVPETKLEKGDYELIPDIYFCIRKVSTGQEKAFFVEIDTGKETIGARFKVGNRKTILQKYEYYEYFLNGDEWKKYLNTKAQAFQILTVTEKKNHINTIRDKSQGKIKFPDLFLCSTHNRIERFGVLFPPVWENLESDKPLKTLIKHKSDSKVSFISE